MVPIRDPCKEKIHSTRGSRAVLRSYSICAFKDLKAESYKLVLQASSVSLKSRGFPVCLGLLRESIYLF